MNIPDYYGIKRNKLSIKIGKTKRVGRFISGTTYNVTDKVTINNKTFKKGQIVHWEDPDDLGQLYEFKIGDFFIYDNYIDIVPKDEKRVYETGYKKKSALGRIPLMDINEVKMM